jgi:hypothetical protein
MLLPISRRRTRVGKEEEASVSSAEENRALARRFIEARVEGDLDALDEMLERVMNSIRNGIGMRETEIARKLS